MLEHCSWKTSTFGAIAAAAGVVYAWPDLHPELHKYAGLTAAICTALLGFYARDNNKSSEDVGAKTVPPATPPATVPGATRPGNPS